MAFVRKKNVKGHEYYQLVESYRENGRMRQRVLAHLGHAQTLEAAIENVAAELDETRAKQRAIREEQWGILKELDRELPKVMDYHGGVPPRYGEFRTVESYARITGKSRPFVTWVSRYGRPLTTNYGRPAPYTDYWGFVGICGRYWRIPQEIEELEIRAVRLEERLEKLKAALPRS
jgi:hypothetical protein